MARLIWTERAVADLDEIAEYIALDNPKASKELVVRVAEHVDQLERHPFSGPVISEFEGEKYRQISETPCRVIYRFDGKSVIVLRVLRSEQLLRRSSLDELE